jgi:outer membrane protein OmpA-like peptidoglycan-associated protein
VHRVYIADRRIDIARAQAETKLAEDQRAALSAQRETARLDARTREADAAKIGAAAAQADSAIQKQLADQARGEVDAARVAAASADEQAAELQRQIDVLQARPTDRGLVLTLGDVLFSTGKADLKSGASSNLDRLVTFLGKYPGRTVMIEGHTDSVGAEGYNQDLSQRRADSVRMYLAGQGVAAERLTAMGKGEGTPVAGNDSASGRQQNRRVEVIINNPTTLASR